MIEEIDISTIEDEIVNNLWPWIHKNHSFEFYDLCKPTFFDEIDIHKSEIGWDIIKPIYAPIPKIEVFIGIIKPIYDPKIEVVSSLISTIYTHLHSSEVFLS